MHEWYIMVTKNEYVIILSYIIASRDLGFPWKSCALKPIIAMGNLNFGVLCLYLSPINILNIRMHLHD